MTKPPEVCDIDRRRFMMRTVAAGVSLSAPLKSRTTEELDVQELFKDAENARKALHDGTIDKVEEVLSKHVSWLRPSTPPEARALRRVRLFIAEIARDWGVVDPRAVCAHWCREGEPLHIAKAFLSWGHAQHRFHARPMDVVQYYAAAAWYAKKWHKKDESVPIIAQSYLMSAKAMTEAGAHDQTIKQLEKALNCRDSISNAYVRAEIPAEGLSLCVRGHNMW